MNARNKTTRRRLTYTMQGLCQLLHELTVFMLLVSGRNIHGVGPANIKATEWNEEIIENCPHFVCRQKIVEVLYVCIYLC